MSSNFATRLKDIRNKKGLTQKQLADKLGISSSTIGMYEQNNRMPSSEILSEMCNIFDVSIDYLLGRTPEKSSEVTDILEFVTNQLKNQECLMYNGYVLNADDTQKLVDAINMAGEIVLRQTGRRKEGANEQN